MARKITVLGLTICMAAMLAAPAWAGGWGRGYGTGPGYYTQLTTEQRAELDKARAKYLQDTLGMRQQLATKGAELRTLMAQPDADKAKIKALSDEMVDLQSQLAKKRNDQFSQLPAGMGWGRGVGCGFARGPRW